MFINVFSITVFFVMHVVRNVVYSTIQIKVDIIMMQAHVRRIQSESTSRYVSL